MSLKVKSFTSTGSAQKEAVTLPKTIFGAKINTVLMTLAVKIFLGNQRHAHSHAQTRGEVNRTGKKLYRQKGTGGARHGSKKAPIFVGGGKAHGPVGNQNYTRRLTQKMRQAALVSALTAAANDQKVAVVTGVDKLDAKTSAMKKLVTAVTKDSAAKKPLLILDKPYANAIKAGSNLKSLTITQAARLNTYEVLAHDYLIVTKEAVAQLANIINPKKAKSNQ